MGSGRGAACLRHFSLHPPLGGSPTVLGDTALVVPAEPFRSPLLPKLGRVLDDRRLEVGSVPLPILAETHAHKKGHSLPAEGSVHGLASPVAAQGRKNRIAGARHCGEEGRKGEGVWVERETEQETKRRETRGEVDSPPPWSRR